MKGFDPFYTGENGLSTLYMISGYNIGLTRLLDDHDDSVYRDRERNVARYNQFRRALFLIPISKWEDLTDDEETIRTLKEVYGDDVEELDTQVGLMAEKKITGFAISETAFVIFIIMASRLVYILNDKIT